VANRAKRVVQLRDGYVVSDVRTTPLDAPPPRPITTHAERQPALTGAL